MAAVGVFPRVARKERNGHDLHDVHDIHDVQVQLACRKSGD